MFFFAFKMDLIACYESESRGVVVYPEVTGSERNRKWKAHKIFLQGKEEKFVTFFQFSYLVAVFHFKMNKFFGRNRKFCSQHGRHAFRFLGSEKTGVVFR